jgi:uncharacterized NAD(P)/FAD-binding protein YdhS
MHLAIVGAGFSGIALLYQLIEQRAPLSRLSLIGTQADFGRGRAYASANDIHLLNVRAADMGLSPDAAGDFADWLELGASNRDAFLPRSLFGDYLQQRIQEAVTRAPFVIERVRGTALTLTPTGAGYRITMDDERRLHADRVVLALGSLPPQPLPGLAAALRRSAAYVEDPWSPQALDALPAEAEVLIVGTGLTCFDLLQTLHARGHRGRVRAISRHGLLPQPQTLRRAAPAVLGPALQAQIHQPVLRELLHALRSACAETSDWRPVLDALRPHLTRLWRGLGQGERARFMRHLRSYWEVHRHRLPLQSHTQLQEWQRSGWLRVEAARLETAELKSGRVHAQLRARGAQDASPHVCDVLIRATGLDTDVANTPDPLVRQLHTDGWLSADPLGLGFKCDGGYGLLNRLNRRAEGLYALGPLLRGEYWEMTAVPELRAAAKALATELTAAAHEESSRLRPLLHAI